MPSQNILRRQTKLWIMENALMLVDMNNTIEDECFGQFECVVNKHGAEDSMSLKIQVFNKNFDNMSNMLECVDIKYRLYSEGHYKRKNNVYFLHFKDREGENSPTFVSFKKPPARLNSCWDKIIDFKSDCFSENGFNLANIV